MSRGHRLLDRSLVWRHLHPALDAYSAQNGYMRPLWGNATMFRKCGLTVKQAATGVPYGRASRAVPTVFYNIDDAISGQRIYDRIPVHIVDGEAVLGPRAMDLEQEMKIIGVICRKWVTVDGELQNFVNAAGSASTGHVTHVTWRGTKLERYQPELGKVMRQLPPYSTPVWVANVDIDAGHWVPKKDMDLKAATLHLSSHCLVNVVALEQPDPDVLA
jgi:hypothetical protein